MNNITKEELIGFTKKVVDLFHMGWLPYILHLSGGNEDELIDIFKNINKGDYVFSTHRSHYHYLLAGGNQEHLLHKIKNGDSMFVFDRYINFYTSSIVAGTPCIAAGVAMALKMKGSTQKVWCFIGDGAEDEGHFYEAVRFVESNNLPCIFVIEDNNKSVDSTKTNRHNEYIMKWPNCVMRYNYIPTLPHCGTGTKDRISFNQETIEKYKSSNK